MTMRLVQIRHGNERRVAAVEEPRLRLLNEFRSIYALARRAIEEREDLTKIVEKNVGEEILDYAAIYGGHSEWKLITPIDFPDEPSRLRVSGTGLTHRGSALERDAMHGTGEEGLTDSMKMFRWGVEGGRPQPGKIGIAPEWFYKGDGSILRRTVKRLRCPRTRKMAGRKRRSRGFILWIIRAGRGGSGWRLGTSFPIICSRRRTI